MPVVPFTGPQPQTLPMPDEQFALMAAAQMHGEGRLVEKEYEGVRKSDNIEDRRNENDVDLPVHQWDAQGNRTEAGERIHKEYLKPMTKAGERIHKEYLKPMTKAGEPTS